MSVSSISPGRSGGHGRRAGAWLWIDRLFLFGVLALTFFGSAWMTERASLDCRRAKGGETSCALRRSFLGGLAFEQEIAVLRGAKIERREETYTDSDGFQGTRWYQVLLLNPGDADQVEFAHQLLTDESSINSYLEGDPTVSPHFLLRAPSYLLAVAVGLIGLLFFGLGVYFFVFVYRSARYLISDPPEDRPEPG